MTDQLVTLPAASVTTAPPPGAVTDGIRGKRQSTLGRMRGDLPASTATVLSISGFSCLLLLWAVVARTTAWEVVPSPLDTWNAVVELQRAGDLWPNVWASVQRVAIGFTASMTIGIALGVLMGSFRSVEAALTSSIGFLRYVPANALAAIFIITLGIDEAPKFAFIIAGTVFYNVLMIADVVGGVPKEQINAAFTLGAGRLRTLRQVVLPHSVPGIIDVARINLAAAWLMLVVAEALAAQSGMYYQLNKLARFRNYGGVWAILLIFGLIGVVSDVGLRAMKRRVSGWADA